MEKKHPVAFASRTLTKAERNYAQVEREALAVISDLQRFHQYLFGRVCASLRPYTTGRIVGGGNTTLLPMASSARIHRWAMIPVISCDTNQAGTLIMQMPAVDYPYNYR